MATVTKSIGATGRDYSTITLWEAALGGAAGGAGNDAVGECYNDAAFDENVVINDSTPNSIKLTVPAAERHDGTAATGARMVPTTSPNTNVLTTNTTTTTTVEWLEFDCNDDVYTSALHPIGTGADQFVSRVLVHSNVGDAVATIGGLYLIKRAYVMNSIIYHISNTRGSGGTDAYGANGATTSTQVEFYNLTVHNITTPSADDAFGIFLPSASTKVVKNCLVTTVTANDVASDFSIGALATEEYNASEDATAAGTGSLTSITVADQYVSTTLGSEDLHLKTGSDCIGAGTDLGTTPSDVEFDIDNFDRDTEAVTWDIGAHQFVAAGGATRPQGPLGHPLNGAFGGPI